jgi:hypothetical protein
MADWRESRQDERIERLEDDLRDAREKIRTLERRPIEWLLKAEIAILWLLMGAFWVFAIVEFVAKN